MELKSAYVLDTLIDEIMELYWIKAEKSFSFFDDNGEEAEGVKLLLEEDCDTELLQILNLLDVKKTTVIQVSSKDDVPGNRKYCYTGWTSQDKFIYEETKFN